MESLKIAAITMCSTSSKENNIKAATEWIRKAAQSGAQWVMLPEVFAWQGSYAQIHDHAEDESGGLNAQLAQLAAELQIILIAGTVGERPTREMLNREGHRRVFNTCYVFGRDGKMIGKYRKAHLFQLNGGEVKYCEPEGFVAGDESVCIDIDGWRCGLAICYDLRFPSFFQSLNSEGPIDMILIPSAFTKKTGEAHWELLLKARAVEMQSYVLAANQTGEHAPGKESYGHSMIIDPWGIKLADTGSDQGFATATVTKARLKEIRASLPCLDNRRPELYRIPQ